MTEHDSAGAVGRMNDVQTEIRRLERERSAIDERATPGHPNPATKREKAYAAQLAKREARLSKELGDAFTRNDVAAVAKPGTARKSGPGALSGAVIRERSDYGFDSDHSYLADVANAMVRADPEATERLTRQNHVAIQEGVSRRDLYINAGNGGELSPPIYLQELFVKKRASVAPVMDIVTRHSLDGVNGQSVTLPKIATNPGVGVQTEADPLNNLTETDATTASATASIVAIGGVQDLSGLLVRRSFPGADAVIIDALAREVWAKAESRLVDTTIQANVGTVTTYTDGTPTLPELFPKIAAAIEDVMDEHHAATHIVMHHRRALAMLAALDSSSRPYISHDGAAMNSLAKWSGELLNDEGETGLRIFGIPVVLSSAVPTTEGSGTNQDYILVGDFSMAHAFTSSMMLDISRDANFKADGVACKAVMDFAAIVARDEAFASVEGTGLVAW